MKVEIEILEAEYGEFSQINLCFEDYDENSRKVGVHIDFLPLYDFAKDTSTAKFDFFLISSIIYGIDTLLSREIYSIDGWAREIEVSFPVNNLDLWLGNEIHLSETLKFLTGDYWIVTFRQSTTDKFFIEKKGRSKRLIPTYKSESVDYISLFSGGLDSLIAAINLLQTLENNKRVIFVSHFDSNSVGPNADQTTLITILRERFPDKLYWIQSTITLSRKDINGTYLDLESSYRSRSFLFLGIGLYLFTEKLNTTEILIPENGTISLNYPLTPSRSSSLSTRTTHPVVINLIQGLVQKTIGNIRIYNPHAFQTKGEMVANCLNQNILRIVYDKSVSCGKRGRKQHWTNKSGTSHCGVCMPCIYRRAALHKKNLDNQIYGNDILSASSLTDFVDMAALFDYLKTPMSLTKIKRDLIVSGSLPFENGDAFADVIFRSRLELLKWLGDKGNDFIRTELGIK